MENRLSLMSQRATTVTRMERVSQCAQLAEEDEARNAVADWDLTASHWRVPRPEMRDFKS